MFAPNVPVAAVRSSIDGVKNDEPFLSLDELSELIGMHRSNDSQIGRSVSPF